MGSGRLGPLNFALMLVTVCALLFGAYGFFLRGAPPTPDPVGGRNPWAELTGPATQDAGRVPAAVHQDGSTSAFREVPARDQAPDFPMVPAAPAPEAVFAPLHVEPGAGPSDRGDAFIEGRVQMPDGRPAAGVRVTCRRSDLSLTPPQLQGDDLQAYREDVTSYLETATRETRQAATDARGEFRFTGLDPLLAYDLRVPPGEGGSGERLRVAAGDQIVILLVQDATLRGRVVGPDGSAVTEFSVRAWPRNRRWEARSRFFRAEDGRFVMSARPGATQVEVSAQGFTMPEPADVEVGADGAETLFTLEVGAWLMGVVTDLAGQPVEGANISVVPDNDPSERRWQQGAQGPSARTDSRGRYRLDSLTPRSHAISARLGEMNETRNVTLHRGENRQDFRLDTGARVRLSVRGPDGDALDPDQVWFQARGGWQRVERRAATERGVAVFEGISPGEYTMTVSAAGFPVVRQQVELRAGLNEYRIAFASGATLSGQITSTTGARISGVSVRARGEDEQGFGGWGAGRQAMVQPDGKYSLGPLEPGRWVIEVQSTGNWNVLHSETMVIAAGENTRDFTVDAGASLTVTLTDAEGKPVSWANVSVRAGERAHTSRAGGNGVATLSFLTPGTYSLHASARNLAAREAVVVLVNGENSAAVRLEEPNCARLTRVQPRGAGAEAGLQAGDVVVEYNGQTVGGWQGLSQAIRQTREGETIGILIDRGGALMQLTVKGGQLGIEGSDAVR
jgi:hypothetical protein